MEDSFFFILCSLIFCFLVFLDFVRLRLRLITMCSCAFLTKSTHSSNSSSFHHIYQINIALTPSPISWINMNLFGACLLCAYENYFSRKGRVSEVIIVHCCSNTISSEHVFNFSFPFPDFSSCGRFGKRTGEKTTSAVLGTEKIPKKI